MKVELSQNNTRVEVADHLVGAQAHVFHLKYLVGQVFGFFERFQLKSKDFYKFQSGKADF